MKFTKTPALMLQGTGSNVGKSVLVAGLARAFSRRGLNVRPFKPQNMSNNAAVTADGGEIGRAQALQARACGVEPLTDMNPVLLKPETETGAQVIVQGKRFGTMRAREYGKRKAELLPHVLESFERLSADADLVLVEGAGSPAEINLRAGDIANMGFAEAADLPVALIGDIDRGGVIAALVGTHAVLEEAERARIKGFLVNKFRGDTTLFADGAEEIAKRTGWRDLGILPFFPDARKLPAEDALDLERDGDHAGPIHIAVLLFERIANFDDLDPLRLDPSVSLTLVRAGEALPGNADLVILPGSKATVADLEAVRKNGWDVDLKAHHRRGGRILGLCGGYQMLGRTISDPEGIEGRSGTHEGLGFLHVETVLTPDKTTVPVTAVDVADRLPVSGYEIHIGRTEGPDCDRPLFSLESRNEGAQSDDGLVFGTYVHGVFSENAFRERFLARFAPGAAAGLDFNNAVETTLDRLADHVEGHLDLEAMARIAGLS
ncbi:MAG: cobyric acid synthase [Hyphomicrobiales bacterium]|nr:cobyric acid synthase [Hyphomicrobiales bacterium]